MIHTIEMFAGLPDIKIEGIDTISVRYKTIVDATKKKNYDILDHRKGEVSAHILFVLIKIEIVFLLNSSYTEKRSRY